VKKGESVKRQGRDEEETGKRWGREKRKVIKRAVNDIG
jgi:hypothetical protein